MAKELQQTTEQEVEREVLTTEEAQEVQMSRAEKNLQAEADCNLLALMREAGFGDTQFVPLARAVGMAPQPLYGKKRGASKADGYWYHRIEELLLKKAAENGKNLLTIEDVVNAAVEYVNTKAAKTEAKKAKKAAAKAELEVAVGDKVSYKTYRAVDGIREYYNQEGIVRNIYEDGKTKRVSLECVTIKEDGEQEVTVKDVAIKRLEAIVEAASEVE